MLEADFMVFILDWQVLSSALPRAARNTGTAIPTRIPMIKITIINSINVKPSCLCNYPTSFLCKIKCQKENSFLALSPPSLAPKIFDAYLLSRQIPDIL
jgi:hypothetical protein